MGESEFEVTAAGNSLVGHVVSPFEPSQTLPVGGGLFVQCSLPKPTVVRQLTEVVTMVLGQGSGFSHCASPNIVAKRMLSKCVCAGTLSRV